MTYAETAGYAAPTARSELGVVDIAFVCLFLVGIYTEFSVQLSENVPFPSVIAGFAGLVLLLRRWRDIQLDHIKGFMLLMIVLLASVFAAPGLEFLGKRFTGLVQLSYSMVISYALFLTLLRATRRQIAAIFLSFSVLIIVGCALEDYTGLKDISDRARGAIYSANLYDADKRDLLLYGTIRPKLFTTEPSYVTFALTFFAFAWFMASEWRFKLPVYVAMMAVGMVFMPGPTLLLMLLLLIPYQFLSMQARSVMRIALVGLVSLAVLVVFVAIAQSAFSARFKQIAEGGDASTFYRIEGPALVAGDVIQKYPLAGAGLTSENFIADDVLNIYRASPAFSADWEFTQTSAVLTNYFWLHWIYFGLVFGVLVAAAVSYWLRSLGIPSLVFCWTVWAIMGQAAGAYVGPKAWSVMLIAAALSILRRRSADEHAVQSFAPWPGEPQYRPVAVAMGPGS